MAGIEGRKERNLTFTAELKKEIEDAARSTRPERTDEVRRKLADFIADKQTEGISERTIRDAILAQTGSQGVSLYSTAAKLAATKAAQATQSSAPASTVGALPITPAVPKPRMGWMHNLINRFRKTEEKTSKDDVIRKQQNGPTASHAGVKAQFSYEDGMKTLHAYYQKIYNREPCTQEVEIYKQAYESPVQNKTIAFDLDNTIIENDVRRSKAEAKGIRTMPMDGTSGRSGDIPFDGVEAMLLGLSAHNRVVLHTARNTQGILKIFLGFPILKSIFGLTSQNIDEPTLEKEIQNAPNIISAERWKQLKENNKKEYAQKVATAEGQGAEIDDDRYWKFGLGDYKPDVLIDDSPQTIDNVPLAGQPVISAFVMHLAGQMGNFGNDSYYRVRYFLYEITHRLGR